MSTGSVPGPCAPKRSSVSAQFSKAQLPKAKNPKPRLHSTLAHLPWSLFKVLEKAYVPLYQGLEQISCLVVICGRKKINA